MLSSQSILPKLRHTKFTNIQKDFVNWGPASYKPIKREYEAVYSLKFRPNTTYKSSYVKHEMQTHSHSFRKEPRYKADIPTGQSESRYAFTDKTIERRMSNFKPIEEVLVDIGKEHIQLPWAVCYYKAIGIQALLRLSEEEVSAIDCTKNCI